MPETLTDRLPEEVLPEEELPEEELPEEELPEEELPEEELPEEELPEEELPLEIDNEVDAFVIDVESLPEPPQATSIVGNKHAPMK